MQETWVQPLGWEDLLEKEMATHSSILAWKISRTEESGRLQSMGLQLDHLPFHSAAGHCQPAPPLETPGHSQASLAQSVRSFFLGPGVHKVLFMSHHTATKETTHKLENDYTKVVITLLQKF